MEWLNYQHLYYFWMIAQEGSLSKAAARLRISHSTMSAQLQALEGFLGEKLFERRGKRLVITSFGTEVAEYAADIFRLGAELVEVARGEVATRRATFRVGVVGSLPKTIVCRLMEPAFSATIRPLVHIRQDGLETLMRLLAANRLHLVLSDSPPPAGLQPQLHTHPLGETGILLYGTPDLAEKYHTGFPSSLVNAPLLLPGPGSTLRRDLDRWFADRELRVQVVSEMNDAGLVRVLGAFGHGLFPVRAALASEVDETHRVVPVGSVEGVSERYYAISLERRVGHPLVSAIIEAARNRLSLPSA